MLQIPITVEVSGVLETVALTKLQKARLLKLLDVDSSHQYMATFKAGVVWLAELLFKRLTTNDVEQHWLVIETLKDELVLYFSSLAKTMCKEELDQEDKSQEVTPKIPISYIGIADRRYVTMTGQDMLLDIASGKVVTTVNKQFLETIQYNLATLFVNKVSQYVKYHETYHPPTASNR